jgi:hypothetical protein
VGFHLSDSGYLAIAALWGGKSTFEGFGAKDPLDQVLLDDRAIHDTMASMIVHQVFTRHPKLKVASCRADADLDHRSGGERHTFHFRVLRRVPLHGGQRRLEPETFLDGGRDELVILLYRTKLIGVCEQQIEQVPRGPVGGLQSGRKQEPQERVDRFVAEFLAVDLRSN